MYDLHDSGPYDVDDQNAYNSSHAVPFFSSVVLMRVTNGYTIQSTISYPTHSES